ncbi:MAG TPA: ribosome biogenesis GTP-binding protein YihA/YsxC [Desulfomonilia bacterium]
MKIKHADYAGTVHDAREHAPEVTFAGRSNAGKSSLINALLGRKNLVQTSKVPGKTRNINYFIVETVEMPPIYMVDMPGYGYARIAKGMKSEWDGLARRYFTGNASLKLLIIVMDIRRDIEEEERMLIDIASRMGVGVLIAATKADKVNMSERNRLIAALKASSTAKVIAVSSVDRSGIDKVWQIVESSIGAPGDMS